MPDIPEVSEQFDNLTTSTDGTNVMPQLQPNSHFFVEGDDYTQSEIQKFGVSSIDEFRTTARVSVSGSKKVYAICQGTVFIQPQEGSTDKVNLILKPFKQPISNIPIKYFIYRGLQKSDFVNGLNVASAGTSATGFINHIWDEFNNFYDGTTAPAFLATYIGYPEDPIDQPSTNYIDQYFYKIATYTEGEEDAPTAYELPVIPKGTFLGSVSGSIGLDIVLNDGDYFIENDPNPFKLDLAFARAFDGILDASGLTDQFQIKLLKENATRFIDPAAFYGLHAGSAGKLYVDEASTALEGTEAIAGRINGFFSKNLFYLYIQSERRRSYNFYDNYFFDQTNANNIQVGVSDDSLTEGLFGELGWPLQIFDETQTIEEVDATVTLKLITDRSASVGLYAANGLLSSANENNFVRNQNLLPDIKANETEVVEDKYTLPITLVIPKDSQNNLIASWGLLNYVGRASYVKNATTSGNDLNSSLLIKDIDNLFGLITGVPFITSRDQELTAITDESNLLQHFIDGSTKDVATVSLRRIEDKLHFGEDQILDRVTMESILGNLNRKAQSSYSAVSPAKESVTGALLQTDPNSKNNYCPQQPYYLEYSSLNDAIENVFALELASQDFSRPVKKALGVTGDQWTVIKGLVASNGLINPSFFFRNTGASGEDYYTSQEGRTYRKYEIGIIAENTTGKLFYYMPEDTIIVYTLDQLIYFTKEYSEHLNYIATNSEDLYVLDIISE